MPYFSLALPLIEMQKTCLHKEQLLRPAKRVQSLNGTK